MFELKPLSAAAIPAALQKAERYRLLNEPVEAESICRDVLAIDPDHAEALVVLVLALSDQVDEDPAAYPEAKAALARLREPYARCYYGGILCERRGKAALQGGRPGSGPIAYQWLREAMELFEQAAAIRPPGNDDALLRWNTCARIIMRHREVEPPHEERFEPMLE
jgi:hypothetical protein